MCVNCGSEVLVVSFGWSTYCPGCGAYACDMPTNFVTGNEALLKLKWHFEFRSDVPDRGNMSKSDLRSIIEHYEENHGI